MATRTLLLVLLLLAIFPGASGAQSWLERTGVNAFFGASPSTEDFVHQMALGEMFETELARLANERGGAKTKAFAEQLLKDHRETTAHIKALVQGGRVKVSLPTALGAAQLDALARLRALSSSEFDKEFEALQLSLHKQAISLFERYGAGGDHPDLKQFAYRHLPHLQEHWRLAQGLTR
ncbi:MAG: DUF4142 domain-containing protein [Xanthobacteraceae bacterium]|nr:DUF4142 domain-containing protein [Xanthobacteraceae bacterium]